MKVDLDLVFSLSETSIAQRLQIESSVNNKNYQFSILSPNICVEQIKEKNGSENIILIKVVETDMLLWWMVDGADSLDFQEK